MAADYDAPRTTTDDLGDVALDTINSRRTNTQLAVVDGDDGSDGFEIPAAELLDEELTVAVVPMRADEFRCSSCFLVHHRSQLAAQRSAGPVCRDCA